MELCAGDRQRAHRAIWDAKPVLREVYGHLYRRMAGACVPGLTLEVGGGCGNFKTYAPDALSFDVVGLPWLDFVADAQVLPVRSGTIANIVMLDVLHHIEYPVRFCVEAVRALAPGGRVVMIEPGITGLSWPFYRFLHDEPVVMSVDPLRDGTPNPGKDPYSGNQAVPTLLVTRHAERFVRAVPGLRLAGVEWLSLFAYPLSCGFKPWSLLTLRAARALLKFEDAVSSRIGRLCAFRLMIVLEKGGSIVGSEG